MDIYYMEDEEFDFDDFDDVLELPDDIVIEPVMKGDYDDLDLLIDTTEYDVCDMNDEAILTESLELDPECDTVDDDGDLSAREWVEYEPSDEYLR